MDVDREFTYRATDASGRTCAGSVSAPNREAAEQDLARRGLRLLSLSEAKESPQTTTLHGGLGLQEFSEFNSLLASMVKSGLPLHQSLHSIVQDTSSLSMKDLIESLQREVEAGSSLSAALRRRGDCFSELYISLVEAGEASGDLGGILAKVARQSKLQLQVRRRVTEALFYPSVLAVAAAGIAIVLSIEIVPSFVAMYQEMGIQLPIATRLVLILFSAPVAVPVGLALILGIVLLWSLGRRSAAIQGLVDSASPLLPILPLLVRAYGLSRFCSSLSSLLRAGVPLPNALSVAARTSPSPQLRRSAVLVCQWVSEGRPFSDALRYYPVFPQTLCWMVSLGERQGNLPEMLDQIAELYDSQAERLAALLDTVLVPAVVLTSGAMIGFFVIAILMPLVNLMKMLGA